MAGRPAKKTTKRAATKARTTKAKKTVARRTTTKKKTTAKPTATKKTVASKKLAVIKNAYKKTEIYNTLADQAELTRKQVAAVFDGLGDLIERHIKVRAAGEFTLPGLLKIKVVKKPATKARKGINPFTGEEMMFKAKPARNIVKIRPLKKLKEMAG